MKRRKELVELKSMGEPRFESDTMTLVPRCFQISHPLSESRDGE